MYAIIRTGGKQYRVEEGRSVEVDRLPAEEGSAVELDNVLLIEDDGKVTIGAPTIEGARVLTEVEAQGRDKKIVVFKYRAKVRTRKKTGHRRYFTRLAVTEILRPGQESKVAKPKRARKAKVVEAQAAEAAPAAAAKEEAAVAAAKAPAAKKPAAKATAAKKAPAAKKPAAKKAPAAKKPAAKAAAAKKPKAEKPEAEKKETE